MQQSPSLQISRSPANTASTFCGIPRVLDAMVTLCYTPYWPNWVQIAASRTAYLRFIFMRMATHLRLGLRKWSFSLAFCRWNKYYICLPFCALDLITLIYFEGSKLRNSLLGVETMTSISWSFRSKHHSCSNTRSIYETLYVLQCHGISVKSMHTTLYNIIINYI
jgi:hypothetical protein